MRRSIVRWKALVAAGFIVAAAIPARAHCDTLDGPVIEDARIALKEGRIAPVLKWIRPTDQAELEEVFRHVREIRTKGEKIRSLADRHFFETLVRLHRAGEGAPYTGLKPAGSVEPVVAQADKALLRGDAAEFADEIASAIRAELLKRFEHAAEARGRKDVSAEEGRAFVEAYIRFVHFAEAAAKLVGHEENHESSKGERTDVH